jgi:hypothetical protein
MMNGFYHIINSVLNRVGLTISTCLLHASGHKPNGTEVDASIIYADYYYLEALLRLKKLETGKSLTL